MDLKEHLKEQKNLLLKIKGGEFPNHRLLTDLTMEFSEVGLNIDYFLNLLEQSEAHTEKPSESKSLLSEHETHYDVTGAREKLDCELYKPLSKILNKSDPVFLRLFKDAGYSLILLPIKIQEYKNRPVLWGLIPVSINDAKDSFLNRFNSKSHPTTKSFITLRDEFWSSDGKPPKEDNSENRGEPGTAAPLVSENGWEKCYLDSFLDKVPAIPTYLQVILGPILLFTPICFIISFYEGLQVFGLFWLLAYLLDYLGIRLITPFATAFWFGWAKAPWWIPLTPQIRNIFIEKKLEGNSVKWKLVEFTKKCEDCSNDRPLEVEYKPVFGLSNFSASCREKKAYHRESFKPF
ncbi:MAG: hypothetical protein KUG71_09940 [Porticoccaceae bacterium]|nr:hypothetical protein [Porticoccaceae bacterium]